MNPVAIACGEPSGIGPEVVLKALAADPPGPGDPGFVLIGDERQMREWNRRLNAGLDVPPYEPDAGARRASFLPAPWPLALLGPDAPPLPETLDRDNPALALFALACLRRGATGCLAGEFSALVTAPVNKAAIVRAGVPFTGQTEYLAQLADTPDVTMLLLGHDDRHRWLRVALATTHLPLRQVAAAINPGAIERTVRHAALACEQLELPRARIAVCGLNPHAGERGLLGDEEERIIAPAIAAAVRRGLDVHGPIPGDTVFYQAFHGAFDAVVAMYHDQGLAPLKLVAFETGVNWTVGLPFVRTSPDHGTAHDIAGRAIADPSSMRSAIRLARQLSRHAVPGSRSHGSTGATS